MSSHDYFERLFAMAEGAKLSDAELKELRAHVQSCVSCREGYADLLVDTELNPTPIRQRFLDRARSEGLQFSSEVGQKNVPERKRLTLHLVPRFAGAAAIVLLTAASGFFFAWRQAHFQSSNLAARNANLAQQLSTVAQTNQELRSRLDASDRLHDSLNAGFSRTRDAYLAAIAQANALKAELESFRTELQASKQTSAQLVAKIQQEEQRLFSVTEEIEKLRSGRAADASTIAAQQKRLDELNAEVAAQREMLDRERQLLAADRDIRELMGARNLHIIDVFDADGRGRNRKAFGRVFLTEGKSLVFYAFDLGDAKVVNAKQSFQAWGQREGAPSSAVNLGIFYLDDQAKKRWVLKFDKPEVLQQVEAVFVTVEPFGGRKQPSGEKLLYAYLRGQPNHP
jgi:uncharacterized coiled-coil protein SlyX